MKQLILILLLLGLSSPIMGGSFPQSPAAGLSKKQQKKLKREQKKQRAAEKEAGSAPSSIDIEEEKTTRRPLARSLFGKTETSFIPKLKTEEPKASTGFETDEDEKMEEESGGGGCRPSAFSPVTSPQRGTPRTPEGQPIKLSPLKKTPEGRKLKPKHVDQLNKVKKTGATPKKRAHRAAIGAILREVRTEGLQVETDDHGMPSPQWIRSLDGVRILGRTKRQALLRDLNRESQLLTPSAEIGLPNLPHMIDQGHLLTPESEERFSEIAIHPETGVVAGHYTPKSDSHQVYKTSFGHMSPEDFDRLHQSRPTLVGTNSGGGRLELWSTPNKDVFIPAVRVLQDDKIIENTSYPVWHYDKYSDSPTQIELVGEVSPKNLLTLAKDAIQNADPTKSNPIRFRGKDGSFIIDIAPEIPGSPIEKDVLIEFPANLADELGIER